MGGDKAVEGSNLQQHPYGFRQPSVAYPNDREGPLRDRICAEKLPLNLVNGDLISVATSIHSHQFRASTGHSDGTLTHSMASS
jgi:hypothetical protein